MNAVGKDAIISARQVSKAYGRFDALRDISLEIKAGELVGLFGSNGAGKSTLLKIFATLMSPSSGEIVFYNRELARDPNLLLRKIGYSAHQVFLYTDLTARENLQFFAAMYDTADADQKISQWLDLVNLDLWADELVRTFSRGMQQRLSLVRAVIHDPEILILDEPYTGLDQDGAQMLDKMLLDFHSSRKTIILVTHDLAQGLRLAQRAIVLKKGLLVHDRDLDHLAPDEARREIGDLMKTERQVGDRRN